MSYLDPEPRDVGPAYHQPSGPIPPPPTQPAPYGQPTSYGQPSPYGQPTPYSQPTPYGVVPYAYPQAALDPRQAQYQAAVYAAQKSRIAAGLLAIFLGALGIHNFYLGRVGIGLIQLLLTVLSLGILSEVSWIWAIIEGILILTRSPSFAVDRRGIPLRD